MDQGKEKRLSREQYKKLWSWIGTKEKAGDDYFERKEREKDKDKKRKEEAKSATRIAETGEQFKQRGAKESRKHYLDYSKKPKSQRIFEQRGRDLENYTYINRPSHCAELLSAHSIFITFTPAKRSPALTTPHIVTGKQIGRAHV